MQRLSKQNYLNTESHILMINQVLLGQVKFCCQPVVTMVTLKALIEFNSL